MADIKLPGFYNIVPEGLPKALNMSPMSEPKTDVLEFKRSDLGLVINVYKDDPRFRFDEESAKLITLRSHSLKQIVKIYRPRPESLSFLLEIRQGYITTPY